jgi:hypothetical protein
MRLPLIGGAYTTRSVIASAQRCINYYSEINPKGALIPTTHYQRPGLDPLFTAGSGPIRGLFRASNEVGYCVSGNQAFIINPDNSTTTLGTLNTSSDPVSMADNGTTLVVVDGSGIGWQTTLGGTDWAVVNDPTGTFQGADQILYLDTYLIWNMPNTQNFGSTLSDQVSFDPLFFGRKLSYPDKLKAIYVNRKEIFLFGDVKSEIWYDAGGTTDSPFAFQPLPGTYIENGIAAPWSRNSHDITVFWLARNLQGEGVVLSFRGYFAQRISNHALEDAILKMQQTVGISDALGFSYQLDGHLFYMLTFPRGNQTWVYDAAVQDPTAAWHQEAWTHPTNGGFNRSRINAMAFINGVLMAGDWENNSIYKLNIDKYTDRVQVLGSYVECPIVCVRGFPHIGAAKQAGGQGLVETDGHRLQFSAFRADMDCGGVPLDINGQPAQISLRWSDDRGHSFGNDILQSAGAPGEYLTQPQWLGMGVARDRIFELSHNIAGPAALNGAWVDAEVLGT